MGIELNNMRTILQALQNLPLSQRRRLLILGDVHVHFSVERYVDLAHEVGFELLSVPQSFSPVSLGESLGFQQTDTLDINGRASLTLNLQHDMPAALLGQFDCLIDAGVLFWCFDPGLALKNVFRLVGMNGLIVHITAISGFYGRCYYNIHPLLFESFYLGNACEHLTSSYDARPRAVSRFRRLMERLHLLRRSVDVTYNSKPGGIYLSEGTGRTLGFGSQLKLPESDVVPNNAVGTLVFKKCQDVEPVEPLLI